MKTWSRWCGVSMAAGLLCVAGCWQNSQQATQSAVVQSNGTEESETPAATPGVPQMDQEMFPSAEMAAGTLKDAVLTHDRPELLAIFGQAGQNLIFTGDRVQVNNELDRFGSHLLEYSNVQYTSDNQATLYVGSDNWPFPIPITKYNGRWFFDTGAGQDVLLDRRIGEDELNAIGVCRVYVDAQREYASKPRTSDGVIQYAQHLMSDAGTQDGLYWPTKPGEPLSPFGPLVGEAREENYAAGHPKGTGPHPYKGYFFHILKSQGPAAPGGAMDYVVKGNMTKGFAMVAFPSGYGATGIMTFIVGPQGVVYQKDLGTNTVQIARGITEFNPDSTWTVVKEE